MEKPSARTVGELLSAHACSSAEHVAIIDGDERLSYAELQAACLEIGAALLAQGVGAGDRVGILAGNRAQWLVAYLGISNIGAIAVGLNTWSSESELAYQLEHADVHLIFIEAQFRERDFHQLVSQAITEIPSAHDLVIVEMDDTPVERTAIGWQLFLDSGKAITQQAVEVAAAAVSGDDIACMLYTSGSTAKPKGVPLKHRGLIDNMWEIGERQHLVPGDRLWLAVSLFWSLASVNALFAALTHRVTIVLQHHFDAADALALIEAQRCTVFYGTPNMVLAMLEHPDFAMRDLGSLRTGVTIGTAAQLRRVEQLGVPEICNVYGLTEAYGNSTVTDAKLPLTKRIESVGQVLPGQYLRIVDPESLSPKASGETGEIILSGNTTPGYWHSEEQNAAAFTADGWFRTGDYGFIDDDGFLYYRGRLKEMIKSGGINIAPAELEQVLSDHEAIELAFITAVPDERLDEAVAAVIVLKSGAALDEQSLREFCKARMASYKTPRHFRFVAAASLPLTSTGKLQRNRLGEYFN